MKGIVDDEMYVTGRDKIILTEIETEIVYIRGW